jgi:N-acetylornithine carbamoyltransferase
MKTDTLKGRDFIRTEDFTKEEIETILDVADDLKQSFLLNRDHDYLHRKTLFMIFYNASLRTRNSFEAGMTQLGGHAHFLDGEKIYMPALEGEQKVRGSEEIRDSAQVLSRMGHGIAIRCFGNAVDYQWGKGNQVVQEYARFSDIPVINMEDEMYHPCQGMADMMTIREKFRDLAGRRLVMSWAYSPNTLKVQSVAHSMLAVASNFGMQMVLAHPKGYELDPEVLNYVQSNTTQYGGSFEITDNMDEACRDADVIYAKSWSSRLYWPPITPSVDIPALQALADANKDWIVDSRRMALAKKKAVYMHCLPCNRGFEVSREVIDGPQSVVYDEAENRMHAQKAIMSLLMA